MFSEVLRSSAADFIAKADQFFRSLFDGQFVGLPVLNLGFLGFGRRGYLGADSCKLQAGCRLASNRDAVASDMLERCMYERRIKPIVW